VSFIDVWAKLKNLPNLSHLRLEGTDLEDDVSPLFLDICKGLESLDMVHCYSTIRYAQLRSTQLRIEKLSVQECEMDIAGFASRCPLLKELTIKEKFEPHPLEDSNLQERMKDLRKHLDYGAIGALQHLDLDMSTEALDIVIPTHISCLRTIRAPLIQSSSIPRLQMSFNNLSEIVTDGCPGFWREVLSSCPGLRVAKDVTLSADDILRGKPWICDTLEVLKLDQWRRRDLFDHTEVKEAIFQRIYQLRKLKALYLGHNLYFKRSVDKNGILTWDPSQ
jgi:hypothetical protein